MTYSLLTFVLLIGQIYLLSALAFGLHFLSNRYGVSLLLMFAAALVAIVTYAHPVTVHLEPIAGFIFTLPADSMIPVLLLTVLVLYVTHGTGVAQMVIIGIATIQLLVALIFLLIHLNDFLPASRTPANALALAERFSINARMMLAGAVAFLADLVTIAIVFQAVDNWLRTASRLLPVTSALLAALWMDALVFNVFAASSVAELTQLLPGDLLSKTVAALALAPLAALYLDRAAPVLCRLTVDRYRPAFDVVHNLFGDWKQRIFHLEAQLRESEANSREVIANLGAIIWMANRGDSTAFFISPASETLLGISPGEYYVDPNAPHRLVHPDDRDQVAATWLRYSEASHDEEFRVAVDTGRMRWLRDRSYRVVDTVLGLDRVIGITEDVTPLHEQRELAQGISKERAKIRTLENLLRELDHDVRQPLMTIDLTAGLAERLQGEPARQARHLSQLKAQARQLERLVQSLLAHAQLEIRSDQPLERLALNPLCEELYEAHLPVAEDAGIHLQRQLTRQPTEVWGHRTDLRRALTNIVSNAIRYTARGGSVTLRTVCDMGAIRIEVSDTGIGIAEEDLARVFDRTYRGRNVGEVPGSGLGLDIARRIVELHDGTIGIQSVLGKGTTVRVSLPSAQPPDERDAAGGPRTPRTHGRA